MLRLVQVAPPSVLRQIPVPVAANTPDAYRLGSVGRPFSTNSVRVTPDGEVVVKGPAMFRGYLGEPLSAEMMTPDGYYRTGPLVSGTSMVAGRAEEFSPPAS